MIVHNLLLPNRFSYLFDREMILKDLSIAHDQESVATNPFRGNIDTLRLQEYLEKDAKAIAFVRMDLVGNEAADYPVSIANLEKVRSLTAAHEVPLVLDASRIVENAFAVQAHEPEYRKRDIWDIIRLTLGHADAMTASLTHDFCVNSGGILAMNETGLFQKLQEAVVFGGSGLNHGSRRLIALALSDRTHVENQIRSRLAHTAQLAALIRSAGAPLANPPGGHCLLIDVARIPEFAEMEQPGPSFLAWLFARTGIRGRLDGAGERLGSEHNQMVRLAIPTGLEPSDVEEIGNRFAALSRDRTGILDLERVSIEPGLTAESRAEFRPRRSIAETEMVLSAKTAIDAQPIALEASSLGRSIESEPARVCVVRVPAMEESLYQSKEVKQCVALERVGSDGKKYLTGYVITTGSFSSERLQTILACCPAGGKPDLLVPINYLPRTSAGEIDLERLARLPAPDQNAAARAETALRKRSGVTDAAVLLRQPRETPRALHLSDLLPGWHDSVEVSQSTEPGQQPSTEEEFLQERPVSISEGAPLSIPTDMPRLLSDALIRATERFPEHGVTCLDARGGADFRGYPRLLTDAQTMAAGLRARGMAPGAAVLFQIEGLHNFIVGFWGCVWAGLIPVPITVAPGYDKANSAVRKLYNAWEMFDHAQILADGPLVGAVRGLAEVLDFAGFEVIDIDLLHGEAKLEQPYSGEPDDVVLIMLTSGSTGLPKGVQQTHRSLLLRSLAAAQFKNLRPEDVSLNWMPLDHVGGIVMSCIRDVFTGANMVHAHTQPVLEDPPLWLDWIDRFRATVTWAPNFAYALINDRAAALTGRKWDLSCLRYIINGGEAVVAKTARRFLQILAPFGLPGSAMHPTWGMSETCSGSIINQNFRLENTNDADAFVEVGKPLPGFSVRVTDDQNNLTREGTVGKLQVRGPIVTPGYYKNPEKNAEVFSGDGWFDTGDLAVLRAGSVTICGRDKEDIVINGVNYYSHEIEKIVEEIEGVAVSFTAAVAVNPDSPNIDRLAIFFHGQNLERLLGEIYKRIVADAGLKPDFLIPVAPEEVPKTAIGKIQRSLLKQQFEAGHFREHLSRADILLENERTIPAWLHRRCWKPRPPGSGAELDGPTLLLLDRGGLGERIAASIEQRGGACVRVKVGPDFSRTGAYIYDLDPDKPEHFQRLAEELVHNRILPVQTIHLWTHDPETGNMTTMGSTGFFAVIGLVRILEELHREHGLAAHTLYVATQNCFQTKPDDRVCFDHGALPGLLKTIPLETDWIRCRHIDLDRDDPSAHADQFLAELAFVRNEPEIAWRKGVRLAPSLESLSSQVKLEDPLEDGAHYLITGGLGGIGCRLAAFLSRYYRAKLLLLGRRVLPPEGEWVGASGDWVENARMLRADHVDFIYESVDITDAKALRQVVNRVEATRGQKLDGVFHLAGDFRLTDHWRDADSHRVANLTRKSAQPVLAAKVEGTLNLHQLIADQPDALFVAFSSLNALFGGATFGAYAAANSFLDAFSAWRQGEYPRTWSLNWSMWAGLGMSRGNPVAANEATRAMGYRLIDPERGLKSLAVLLRNGPGQYLIGLDAANPHIRPSIEEGALRTHELVGFVVADEGAALHDQCEVHDRFGTMLSCALTSCDDIPRDQDGKPEIGALLDGPSERHTGPRNETENQLAMLWTELLGVADPDIHANFFELGGHSLLAGRLLARLRDRFALDIPLRGLFETPTIAGLAERLEHNAEPANSLTTRPNMVRPIPRLADRSRTPLSFAQQRLYFIQESEPDLTAYNELFAWRIVGDLREEPLNRAFQALVERHEILRTTFVRVDDEPVQIIASDVRFRLEKRDFTNKDDQLEALIDEERRRVFDLKLGPLFRAVLVVRGTREFVLVLSMHHIVIDGWSMGVLLRDLAGFYREFSSGAPSNLPEPRIQYADYAVWQNTLAAEGHAWDLEWWAAYLGDGPLLDLPLDHTRSNARSFRGRNTEFHFALPLSDRLRILARQEDTTLFIVVLTLFRLLLARYSHQEDILIGTPVANRGHVDAEALIGFFVNTLVLRSDLDGARNFRSSIQRVKETTLEAMAREDVPFERVVETLNPERVSGRNALFDVMFAFQEALPDPFPDLESILLPVDRGTAHFDLTLEVWDSGSSLSGIFNYNVDLFEAATIERMIGHLMILTESLSARPDSPRNTMTLLQDAEVDQLGYWWRERGMVSWDRPLHETFTDQAAARPDATALIAGDRFLSYRVLDRESAALAGFLTKLGLKPGVPAGLAAEHEPCLVIGMLAILKAGGVLVPLDPAYPMERVSYMSTVTGCHVVLTTAKLADRLLASDLSPSRVILDNRQPTAVEPTEQRLPEIEPEQPGVILFTSGTTGRPKGVVLALASLTAKINDKREVLGIGPGHRYLVLSSISFDPFLEQVLLPLTSGATAILRPAQVDPASFQTLLAQRLDTVDIVPSLLQALLPEIGPGPRVRNLILGGEALTPAVRDLVRARNFAERMFNLYGPTEAMIDALGFLVPAEHGASEVPIGVPLAGYAAWPVDPYLNPVPIGLTGELVIAGVGLAYGYLNRPDLTAERFTPDPLADTSFAGSRVYRTGDLARCIPGAGRERPVIVFMGRIDKQVKLRGQRLEPAEIESVLGALPGVRQTVVLVRQSQGQSMLVAYFTAEPEFALEDRELAERLAQQIPVFMVPSAFVRLDELPLTPNGKLDHRALPAPEQSAEVILPTTPVECALASIWETLLQPGRSLGVRDNFFVLGGHSLLAMRVVSRIEKSLAVKISVRDLFDHPTIGRLAGFIENQAPVIQSEHLIEKGMNVAGIRLDDPAEGRAADGLIEADAPLSFAQQRLWFIQMRDRNTIAYNVPTGYRIKDKLDETVLASSLEAMVERHEILRTRFVERDGAPRQMIVPAGRDVFALIFSDLSGEPDPESAARQSASDEARHIFDLERGPLSRVVLMRLAETEYVLMIHMHHIICDGWSSAIFGYELSRFYRAYLDGKSPRLPKLTTRYIDYAANQRRLEAEGVMDAQRDWWRERLKNPPILDPPIDRPRPKRQTFNGAVSHARLSTEQLQGLNHLAREESASLFQTVFTAFGLLLSRYTGQNDILIGTPVANRTDPAWEGLIGLFVNTVVLRYRPEPEHASARLLLGHVRELCLDSLEHGEFPFDRLVEALNPERDPSRNALFQVMFALEREMEREPDWAPFEFETVTTHFDLTFSLFERKNGLDVTARYNRDLFDAETMEQWMRHYLRLLVLIVNEPDRRLTEISLLDDGDRRKILSRWNQRAANVSEPVSLIKDFRARAALQPDRVALIEPTGQITYGRLAAKAERLAAVLAARGVGPEVVVAICMDRSTAMVASMLAVLTAGGAYLPLDPQYPIERVRIMLADSGAVLLMTRGRIEAVASVDVPKLDLDTAPSTLDPPAPTGTPDPGNLAYLIYTSGSTGRPKGVAIEHRSASALIQWAARHFDEDCWSGVLASTSICFDLSVFEIFATLGLGGGLVMADHVLQLPNHSAAQRVTLINTVPSAMAELVAWGPLPDLVHTVNLAGEPCPGPLIRAIYANAKVRSVYNLYGPSEDTTYSTSGLMGRSPDAAPHIGLPIDGTRAYIVDRDGQPLPVGAPGELLLGGAGLSRGYWSRPETTAERFTPDPFSGETGMRLYRTGDRVRWRVKENEPALYFLGRLDHQVKLRGFRIEPGEIETVLCRNPLVDKALVTVYRDESGDRLVAYIQSEKSPSPEPLAQFTREALPDYMVPSDFIVLSEFPLSPNGKIDRGGLPAPGPKKDRTAYVAPENEIQKELAAIWSELLHVEQVGIHDDFFRLGGHSLLAVRVLAAIRKQSRLDVNINDLFDRPTIAQLAKAPRILESDGEQTLSASENTENLPLSFSQQRLWFIQKMDPGSVTYNVPLAIRLDWDPDPICLEKSIAFLVSRHAALRTVFQAEEGVPTQTIYAQNDHAYHWRMIDLQAETSPEKAARGLAGQDAEWVFDLEKGPLLRVLLMRLGPGDWVLFLNLHHIVCDGWSLHILLNELANVYTALKHGDEPELPELTVRYVDYAVWQRSHQDDEDQIAWWRRQLRDAPLLELPTRPREKRQNFDGGVVPFKIEYETLEKLRKFAREQGATLFQTLFTAFGFLLTRYSGQNDILIGTPIANRPRSELEGLIGFFVNTVVLRFRLTEAEPSFVEALKRARKMALNSFVRGETPFEKLVEALNPERDPSRNALFQVVFTLESWAEAKASDFTWTDFDLDGIKAHFDLNLTLSEKPGFVKGSFIYNTSLFPETTIVRWSEHYRCLLELLVRDPKRPLAHYDFLGDEERRRVLSAWSGQTSPYPDQVGIADLFAEQAARRPDAVALDNGAKTLTYAALDRKANQLAHFLAMRGVGPENSVGVCMPRSLETVIGLIAILKAGGVYAPLDPGYPLERLKFMVADTGSRVILAQKSAFGKFDLDGVGVILLEPEHVGPDWEEIDRQPVTAPSVTIDGGNLAYIMYTSGSTGRAKGVRIPQRAVIRLVRESGFMTMDEQQVFLLLASISFDASTLELWASLLNGGRLMVFPGRPPSLNVLGAWLLRHRVTSLWLTVGLFHQMVDLELGTLTGLRHLVAGGDVLSPVHINKLLESLPRLRLINGYGPTENTTFTCCYPIKAPIRHGRSAPIGRPIGNTRVYILDPWLNPVPIGVTGELWTGGDGLARDYLNRSELTAERFAPNPFDGRGQRIYRTGDRVRFRADGVIEFVGRVDRQIKLRGLRIEPGEIERHLTRCPGVQDAHVLVRQDSGDKRLVAYLIGSPDSLEPRALTVLLRQHLPEYMIPSDFVLLESFPLTANGKLDRARLPAPEWAGSGRGVTPPRTAFERDLAEIWREILGREVIGVHDNFFDLGGHSLLATLLIAAIRKRLGRETGIRDLFERPTIAELAELLENTGETENAPVVAAPRDENLPLSFSQQRLWFIQMEDPSNTTYNLPIAIRVKGELDQASFEKSLFAVTKRQESLRTIFIGDEDTPFQFVRPPSPDDFALNQITDVQSERETRDLVRAEADHAFNLERGPLLRVTLISLGPGDRVLILNMHHIICDGWSVGIILRELFHCYAALRVDRPLELPELAVQYADYSVWQRKWLLDGEMERQTDWWLEQLKDAPVLDLPIDKTRPKRQTFAGAAHAFKIPAELLQRLKRLGGEQGATLFQTLLTAFAFQLGRYAGQDDILIGTPAANRTRAECEHLIGFFVNMLVLRVRLDREYADHRGFRGLINQVREMTLDAYAHQDLPFEKLVETMNPERDQSRSALFQVMFTLENVIGKIEGPEDLKLEAFEFESETTHYDLKLTLQEGDGIAAILEYNTDLFERETIARWAVHFSYLLRIMAADPDRSLTQISMLDAAEQRTMLGYWNRRAWNTPEPVSLVCLFQGQAAKSPDAVSLIDAHRQVTYSVLANRANRLAGLLKKRGVGPERIVGICMDRSTEMAAAMLAVLTASGAYLPLDPHDPAERIAFMLADGDVVLLLTQEKLCGNLPASVGEVVCLDQHWPAEKSETPLGLPEPENLAYLIYSSGSTGQPKGVAIPHRAATAMLHWADSFFKTGDWAGVLASTSICSDLSVFEIFGALTQGGSLVIAADALDLKGHPHAERVTTLINIAPSAMTELVALGALPRSVRVVNLAGEPFQQSLIVTVYSSSLVKRVYNLYAPSGGAAYSTAALMENRHDAVPTIGSPIDGTRAYVTDRFLQPLPVGASGELLLGGAGLNRGYLARPDMTAEKYAPDPFSDEPGARLYRTGDRVKWRVTEAGPALYFLGRLDH